MKEKKQNFLKKQKKRTDKNKEKISRKINKKIKASKETKARLNFLSSLNLEKEKLKDQKTGEPNDNSST